MKIEMPYFDFITGKWRDVLVEIVDVAPHLIATFAVHRPLRASGWHVSNIETGFKIERSWAPTRKGSIERARKFLAGIDQATLDGQLEKCRRGGFKKPITPPMRSAT